MMFPGAHHDAHPSLESIALQHLQEGQPRNRWLLIETVEKYGEDRPLILRAFEQIIKPAQPVIRIANAGQFVKAVGKKAL